MEFQIRFQMLMDLSLFNADFKLFVRFFHRFHFVKFVVVEKLKIHVFYAQMKTNLYKKIIQRQNLFDFTYYLRNWRANHEFWR